MSTKHQTRYICLNGDILPADIPAIDHNNRAFCYGDALFETIHANGTKIQFFHDHHSRLLKGMSLLKMDSSRLSNSLQLEMLITKLLNKNRLFCGARVRLTVFRDSGGFYTPTTNNTSFILEASPLQDDRYILNRKGLHTVIFREMMKHPDNISNLKTANSLLYILAGIYSKENGFDESILLNTEKRVVESVSSNVFILKSGRLITPELSEGCVAGVMRKQVIRIATSTGIECIETKISEDDLLEADELFFTNAIKGVTWAVAFGERRYFNKTAKTLTKHLNNEQFGY